MARHLSPHFTLEEFTVSETAARRGLDNMPPEGGTTMANLNRTAEVMEQVRSILNNQPITITSGYRSEKVNAAVGGSKLSAHMAGLAVDFICPDFGTPLQICHALQHHMADLEIDQLIHEFGAWVHLGLSTRSARHQKLTIDSKGTRNGFG